MNNFLIWTVVAISGFGLIFDASIRNDYYTAFSYLFPTNTKQYQDLADTTRLVIGLAMALSVFNVFGGLLLKLLSIIGFVIYAVVINQDFLVNPTTDKLKQITSVATHITLLFLCMDSIIAQIIRLQTQQEKSRTRKAIETAKKQAEKVSQQSQNKKKQKPSSGKSKGHEEAKHDKKQQKSNQKQKKQ